MVRPGKSGPKGMRCDKLMKFGLPSGGCDPRPAKGGPPRPVASLATVTVTRPAMRRCASVRAVGNAATKIIIIPGAEGVIAPEGDGELPRSGQGKGTPGGVYDHGT